MREFDKWLQDALIDANLLQFETVLAEADGRDFGFSPKYLRERMRMLADPFSWAKRRQRSPGRRLARNIACVLLACTVAFGALMAASPSVRAAVLNWLRGFGEDTVTYSSNPYAAAAPEEAAAKSWHLTWLPEEYVLQDAYINLYSDKWYFYSSASGSLLDFSLFAPSQDAYLEDGRFSDPESIRERVSVQGRAADYYANGDDQLLVWESPDGFLLRLAAGGQEDLETLVKIAESAAPYDPNAAAYETGWVPPDFHEMHNREVNRREWALRGNILCWQYVVQPVCPFDVPEGEPEEVSVNGLPGRYWANLEELPDGPDESMQIINGTIIVSGSLSAADNNNVLIWEDPETGTAFSLRGAVEKDDLLRIAESVKRREEPIEPAQPGHNILEASGIAHGGSISDTAE